MRTFSRLGEAIDGTDDSVDDSAVRVDCCRNVVDAGLVFGAGAKADAEESTARRAKVDNLAILLYLKSWKVMLLMRQGLLGYKLQM